MTIVQVLVHGTFKTNVKPNRKDITSILAAGGATLLSMQEAVAQGVDLAIMPPGTAKTVPRASLLVNCVSAGLYVSLNISYWPISCLVTPHKDMLQVSFLSECS